MKPRCSTECAEEFKRMETQIDALAVAATKELGWLIETASGEYWNGRFVGDNCRGGFVDNPDEAIRFARQVDAEVVRSWLFGQPGQGLGWSLRTAQHKWVDGTRVVTREEMDR